MIFEWVCVKLSNLHNKKQDRKTANGAMGGYGTVGDAQRCSMWMIPDDRPVNSGEFNV